LTPTNGSTHNDATGKVAIELDHTRHLKFSWHTFEILEQRLKRGFLSGDIKDTTFNGFTELKVFIWAGLLEEDPELSEADVNAMLDSRKMKKYQKAVYEAIQLSLVDEGETSKAKGEPADPPQPAII
jgi:hypothetical protein